MPYGVKVDDVCCSECGEDEVYMDLKEEPGLYKIGAVCDSCDRDYGVLETVPRGDIKHSDGVWEEAEAVVRGYFQ